MEHHGDTMENAMIMVGRRMLREEVGRRAQTDEAAAYVKTREEVPTLMMY